MISIDLQRIRKEKKKKTYNALKPQVKWICLNYINAVLGDVTSPLRCYSY